MTVKIGINGFGRIGRNLFRALLAKEELQVVAINDLTDNITLAHLLKYDSLYGRFPGKISLKDANLLVNGREISILAQGQPEKLPWRELGVELVLEATGRFRTHREASRHLQGGAKKVIVATPVNDADLIVVMGINERQYDPAKHHILSNASCTTNGLAPVVKVLHENFGLLKGLMNTTHAYTNDQQLLDLAHSDLRRARAAQLSLIPTTTGAAKVIGKIIPELKGRIDGFAVRVPTPTVSMVDFVAQLQKETSAAEINEALKAAAEGELRGILGYTDEPLVSVDYKGSAYSSVVDSLLTMVIGGNLARVVAWYDNEWGYSQRLADLAAYLGRQAARI
ncbi:MAG: type I glyceraldehyde-3-phosphate dehydrogenase [Firmicutes bacterium]|nr:type I glyceraldehyde-3-phosphate dehydrogenase [Dethiobacter sp.]MBS3899647.1 type I glyceraldehyde-3-phosphate dehydrogenase [Dethiobacter sp.]MCL4463799.1 type I glyceraldehyde-3-phosphate dehydrogenase [Bacillota bacterium]MCL5994376.1 type I glyceraldehyde-3-phosphate dehydrogenase [Bacillota bacterium]